MSAPRRRGKRWPPPPPVGKRMIDEDDPKQIKEKGSGPVYVESIGGTSAVPGDGLYSTPFQMYSPFCQMNDKKKDS
ncbi:hypothetical protein E3N88_42319 [Mikania micrantha]|uniref:Uncharacterized protein n=1 Tax=Mikania micrantha TaxID=192012 RepID=A0A5N6LJ05_9ASTR|nr:hypothetical protein E3N88_42319 [Mikania micrantha]